MIFLLYFTIEGNCKHHASILLFFNIYIKINYLIKLGIHKLLYTDDFIFNFGKPVFQFRNEQYINI